MKKKLLVLTSTFPRWPNDPDPPFVFDLSRRLSRHFEVYILAPHTSGAPLSEELDGLTVIRFKYAPEKLEVLAYNGGIITNLKRNPVKSLLVLPFILSELLSAYRLIKQHNIDVIHAHWILPQGLVVIMLKLLAKSIPPVLCTAHGADVYTQKSRLMTSIKRFILNRCDCITVVSNAMKVSVLTMGITRPIFTMPMGTNLTERFIPGPENEKKQQIIFVGRLVEKKGISYLLDAFAGLHKSFPEYQLLIIGEGPEEKHLKVQARQLGIEKSVDFKGGLHHDKLPSYYQTSEIAVFPFIKTGYGDQEGFGLVLVEAMGCQCCVVTTNIDTVKDIVLHEETGILVKEKDSNAIYNALTHLIDDADQKFKMASNGRHHVKEHFGWEKIAVGYADLIGRIISNKSSG